MEYLLLDSDEKLLSRVSLWNNLDRIAVDFEGEFNLHVYGEHLCLIQVYDGTSFYLIDPRNSRVTKKGLCAFFSTKVKKLWFDCHSDLSLVVKNYGVGIEGIYDLRVLAKALGYQGNLLGLEKEYLGLDIQINKKKNQQANWMKRPIEPDLIEYALLDVAYLMDLEPVLFKEVVKRKLEKNVEKAMKKAVEVKKIEPGWMKIGSWRHFSPRQRIVIKNVYIARDKIAQRFNVPAARVMNKHWITELAINTPKSQEEVARLLKDESPRFVSILVPAIWNALEASRVEDR